jgi:hypothetical protein
MAYEVVVLEADSLSELGVLIQSALNDGYELQAIQRCCPLRDVDEFRVGAVMTRNDEQEVV